VEAASRWLALGGADGFVEWRRPSLPQAGAWIRPATRPRLEVGRGAVTALAISPDGRWLVAATEDSSTARLWNLAAPEPPHQPYPRAGHIGRFGVTAVAFSPDSRWLATGGYDKKVRLWPLNSADPSARPRILTDHEGSITALAFSPDGRWLATGDL